MLVTLFIDVVISNIARLDSQKFFSSYYISDMAQMMCKFVHAVDPMVRHPDHL